MGKQKFKSEVSQLLHLIIHSLYSHREIFIRELISNSSDALDKLKYLTLTDENFKKLSFSPAVNIEFADGEKEKTLTVSDNGIGMNQQELRDNLGTIARSGTKNFLSRLSGDEKKDANLIGQFGVGFYSAFMVADRISVLSRRAGEQQAWLWKSDGKESFTIDEAERDQAGTTITLYLNKEGEEYASRWQLESLIKKYSDHIAFPIFLTYDDKTFEGEGDDKKEKIERKTEQINAASALWRRPKSQLSKEDYHSFYKGLSFDGDEPLCYFHTQAEGTQEYTTLFFIPKTAPLDLFQADYRSGIKLYIKRVFITDDDRELMPTYLRFLRGIIDSEDLPLNVSREILQKNTILTSIKSASVKKVLTELKKIADNNPELYTQIIEQYNRPLKEGLYSDYGNRETLQELVRFKSTKSDGFVSLKEYKERMAGGQKSIYYVTGGDEQMLRHSPLLEAYKKKDFEVLIAAEEIDEIVLQSIPTYQDMPLKAVNRSDTDDELKSDDDGRNKESEKEAQSVVDKIAKSLGDRVKSVKVSSRLIDSPACIVVDSSDPSLQMQQMLKAMGQSKMPDIKPILEINPAHTIIKSLQTTEQQSTIDDMAAILLDQALLLEGMPIANPAEFVKKINKIAENALEPV